MTFNLYIDESIHDRYDFIVVAMITTSISIDNHVENALISAGLKPKIEEYKSSSLKSSDLKSQNLREDLIDVIFQNECKISLLICNSNERNKIAEYCLNIIQNMKKLDKFNNENILINFDDGIISQTSRDSYNAILNNIKIEKNADSREIFGLQLADMIAHLTATILKCDLEIIKKSFLTDSDSYSYSGYEPNTKITLEFELWAKIRYALAGSINTMNFEHDDIDTIMNCEPFGFFISENCEPNLKEIAIKRFGSIYVGCIH